MHHRSTQVIAPERVIHHAGHKQLKRAVDTVSAQMYFSNLQTTPFKTFEQKLLVNGMLASIEYTLYWKFS